MPSPPALPDELLEEIFLCLSPDEPVSLVRASLVSKPWLTLLTGPRFNARYREFHGSPPMLGFLCSTQKEEDTLPLFISTTNFGARIPDDDDWVDAVSHCSTWDCRHGRVLLYHMDMVPTQFIVWDPMTGCRSELRAPEDYASQRAAVQCAVSGCDHGACHEGPFRIIFVGLENDEGGGIVAYVHMSLPGVPDPQWTKPCTGLNLEANHAFILDRPSVFIGDAFYFMLGLGYDDDDEDNDDCVGILKYDLGSNFLSLFDAPPWESDQRGDDVILVSMENGGLGFAHLDGLTLTLWSMQMGRSNTVPTWTQPTVINLKELTPVQNNKETTLWLTGSVEGSGIILVTTHLGIYQINLKSLQWKKLWRRETYHALFPYMSFYNPREKVSPYDVAH